MNIKRIAVIGATGMLGVPVTRELQAAGFDVTAIVRDIKKGRRTLSGGVEMVQGELEQKDVLEKVFRGMDAVYLSLSTTPDEKSKPFKTEKEGVANVIRVAEAAGIKRIGYLSSLVKDYRGIDWWVFDVKRLVCRMLEESGIPSTIFCPSNFFENFPYRQIVGNRVVLGGDQVTRSWWIGARDYGRQVAESFKVLENENKRYPIQGPEPFSYEEAADVFIANYTRKKLRKLKIPVGLMRFFGRFSKEMEFGAHIVEAINRYDERFEAEQT